MDIQGYRRAADIFKALGHPARLCIVSRLMTSPLCNVSLMQGCLGLPQSTLSQHLAVLRAKRIVVYEKHGTEMCYSINPQMLPLLETIMQAVSLPQEEDFHS